MEQIIQEMWNHIAVINDEIGHIQISIAILETQMASIIYWGRFLGGAVAIILITQLFQIIQIKKNNKKQ